MGVSIKNKKKTDANQSRTFAKKGEIMRKTNRKEQQIKQYNSVGRHHPRCLYSQIRRFVVLFFYVLKRHDIEAL